MELIETEANREKKPRSYEKSLKQKNKDFETIYIKMRSGCVETLLPDLKQQTFFMEIPKINRIFNNFILQKKWNFCKPLHIHRNRSSTNIDNGKCTFKNGLLFRVLLIIDKVKPPF